MGITSQQALDCFASDDLIGIGMEADAVRRSLHPEGVVTYVIDRTIDASGTPEAIYTRIAASVDLGITGILLQTAAQPDRDLPAYEALFAGIKQRFPALWLQALSAPEVLALAATSALDLRTTLARLQTAGLDSIPGTGASILPQDHQDTLPDALHCSPEDWLTVHRTAHTLGLRTTASMTFGLGESMPQRIQHLERIRQLQHETGGFTAFIPMGAQFQGARALDEPTAVEYLKTLAISRLYLDNIDNIQTHWPTQGLKVLQMGLRFGSNDAGSTLPESTTATKSTEEELRRIIRDAGFKPIQRDTLYRTMFLN
jgi:cyclic dehypoxanthinyl futalosine synthase